MSETVSYVLADLHVDYDRCLERFVGVDGLVHLCDEVRGHRVKHFCRVHRVLEHE